MKEFLIIVEVIFFKGGNFEWMLVVVVKLWGWVYGVNVIDGSWVVLCMFFIVVCVLL